MFKIRPKAAYHHAGMIGPQYRLDPNKVYIAEYATNQPDWKKRAAVFVSPEQGPGLLLEGGDYTTA